MGKQPDVFSDAVNTGEALAGPDADPPWLLVIDDERDIGEFISDAAAMAGYRCRITTSAGQFRKALDPDIALIMMDLVMPDTDGIELLRYLGEQRCQAPIILMSGFDKRVLQVAEQLATEHGLHVAARLQKPFRLAELRNLLEQCSAVGAASAAPRSTRPVVVTASDLQQAIARDEFVLHYQPQIDIRSGRVVGIEALVRWMRPDYGLVYPDAFIGVAESLGLIESLTWLIIHRGFSERRAYADRYPDMSLSVNVSARSLNDLTFPDTVLGLANTYGVSPSNLILEITESGLLNNLARSLDVLTRLRVKQMRMSIDDFGTGYAMMQQLRRVPATELKIDKSFVQDMHRDESARALVHKTIELGHELDMSVTAEGVETEEQLDVLRARGCDIGQGYFFSRPVPLSGLLRWLEVRQPQGI